MATIFVNGCFDILHDGHIKFLTLAKFLPLDGEPGCNASKYADRVYAHINRLVVAVNSDESARKLKAAKWGQKYPIDSFSVRMSRMYQYADQVFGFEREEELRTIILTISPCIIVKGPDYAGKRVTGDDLAPVLILDTPEPESVKEMKRRLYGLADKLGAIG